MCILFVYIYCTLLKVVSYDLGVLSMSVMGFHKMFEYEVGVWGGGVSSFFRFWKFCNFQSPLEFNRFAYLVAYITNACCYDATK